MNAYALSITTVEWDQPSNPLGGKQHIVDFAHCDGTLCGLTVPLSRTSKTWDRLPTKRDGVCVWCIRKLRRFA